jgi:hypothetical protein
VQRSCTISHAINPSAASVPLNEINIKGQDNFASLAAATGGTAFPYVNSEDLDGFFRLIAVELQAQYLLAYYSTNLLLDGRFRQIKVSIPNRVESRDPASFFRFFSDSMRPPVPVIFLGFLV